ncbi:hypothetical protein B0T18DRAFT_424814 [Schizothecium vesticola]|uniref:Uncharacterized protein n=1 Tax=Schizothecium vesticola TaxID=314040 RepID=A0AA40KCR5_9PEZI|nr:hypothetical protein B0T18DRAFT_424814 [Schizothecium vesticola]
MDVGDTVASPGAPPDDVDEVMRRKVKDILLTVQRDIQVVFEREKETLGNARKTLGNARKMLDDKIRHIQEEMRKLEQSLRELATKERRLEANYHADMRKLDRWREDGVVDLQRSAPGVKRPRNDNPTVSYEEVYGNGRPQYRHAIVEYPKNSGKWFIIRCDKCGLHFGRNALQGGAKHLNGVKHGHLPREHVVTIRELGFRVLGCNKDKAKRNNDAFDRASRAGYAPHKRRTDQARWQSQESDEPGDEHPGQQRQTRRHPGVNAAALQTRHQRGKPFQGITDPIVGRLYRAWYRGGGFFVALMLPLGSFGSVGVVGKISNMLLGQQKKAPRCYDRSGERIIPWASGYEDGGPKFRERRFPMMYFEESAELSFKGGLVVPPSLGWVEAKHLRPFDVDDPECRLTKGFSNARAFLALTGRESDRGSARRPEGLATNLWRGNSRAADQASQGTDDRGDNTQDDGTETEDEVQSSIRERRVSASASPPRSATPTTMNQDDEEDEDNGDEDEEDEDEEDEDDEGEDDEDEDDEDEDEGEDGEMVDGENAGGGGDNDRDKHGSGAPEDDQGTEDEAQDRVLSRPVPGAVYPLISAAQIQGESVAAAAEHEGYSHNSRREPNVPAPVDGEHRSGKPGPREVLTSQQGSAHETSNQDEQARQNGLMGTQNLVKATDQDPPHAAAQSGTPGKPIHGQGGVDANDLGRIDGPRLSEAFEV